MLPTCDLEDMDYEAIQPAKGMLSVISGDSLIGSFFPYQTFLECLGRCPQWRSILLYGRDSQKFESLCSNPLRKIPPNFW